MQVFKTFLKIIKANRVTIMIYFILSLSLSFAFSSSDSIVDQSFSSTKEKVAVIDRDGSSVSKALTDFFNNTNTLVELEDDLDKMQDALFYREVTYLVIVPSGFGEGFLKGEDVKLDITTSPNSYSGIYMDMQTKQFLTDYCAYLASGLDAEEALTHTLTTLSIDTTVNMVSEDGSNSSVPGFASFFQFMAYGIIAVLINCVGTVMLSFNRTELYNRMNCSSMPLRKRNFQTVLGCFLIAFIVWGIYSLVVIVRFGADFLTHPMSIYLLINSFALTLVSLSLGFLFGTLSKSEAQSSIYSVSAAMFLSFLGGVFVPLSSMSPTVVKFSHFIPTYWYMINSEALLTATSFTDSTRSQYIEGIAIQLAFAAAVFAIALLLSKKKTGAKAAVA